MSMAEETDKSNIAAENTSDANTSAGDGDEMIDLEGLVKNIDLTPTDAIAGKRDLAAGASAAGSDSEAPESDTTAAAVELASASPGPVEQPLHAEALDPAQIDEILNIEDPEMAAQVEAIRAAGFKKGETDAAIEDDEEAGEVLRPIGKSTIRAKIYFNLLKIGVFARSLKTLAIRSVKDSKGLLHELLKHGKLSAISTLQNLRSRIAVSVAWLKSRSVTQKLSLFASFAALALLIFVGAKTIQGTLLPNVERNWVASFADHADGKFTYEESGSFEDFNDPLLHPEFVILVERIVVNLHRTPEAPESANPMAAFELYLQTDNQDAAIEIKDRSVEIRDAVARSVERMTYPDLADEDGKAKLKLLIRKDLNEFLTRGKVRRVFFKTIVLNPES
jgi:flagellar basal body-associated protein FliL